VADGAGFENHYVIFVILQISPLMDY